MKIKKLSFAILGVVTIMSITSCDTKPYILEDGYVFIQKEKRRNDSIEWQLVWEDDFNTGSLDTNTWSRIGLFTSPKWKVPVENWREVKGCFRYITATDPRVIAFDDNNMTLTQTEISDIIHALEKQGLKIIEIKAERT